jgi:hypothetical protein
LIPAGSAFVLVDDDQWGAGEVLRAPPPCTSSSATGATSGRRRTTPPPSPSWSACAAAAPTSSCSRGRHCWWLDHYPHFHEHLRKASRAAWRDDDLALFDLRPARGDYERRIEGHRAH